jgi:hypothetical protein
VATAFIAAMRHWYNAGYAAGRREANHHMYLWWFDYGTGLWYQHNHCPGTSDQQHDGASGTTTNQPVGEAAVAYCHGTMIRLGWIPAVLRASLPIIASYAVARAVHYSQATVYRHTKPCRNGLATILTNVRTTWHCTVATVSSGVSGSRSALRLAQRVIAAAYSAAYSNEHAVHSVRDDRPGTAGDDCVSPAVLASNRDGSGLLLGVTPESYNGHQLSAGVSALRLGSEGVTSPEGTSPLRELTGDTEVSSGPPAGALTTLECTQGRSDAPPHHARRRYLRAKRGEHQRQQQQQHPQR